MEKLWIVASTFAFASCAVMAQTNNACNMVQCRAGAVVKTVAPKGEPFYACATAEVSDYANVVLGFVALTKVMGGHMPNISPETGEPEYEGESKQMIDAYRTRAKVRTFDEAIARCVWGKNGQRVTVMNDGGANGFSMWVAPASGQPYWMPKGAADLIKP